MVSRFDTALERVPRQLLPNPSDVGPLQLSSIASSAREQSGVQTAAKPTKVQAPKSQTAQCKGGSLEFGDGDDSSWGDGTSTEEDITALDGPVPDDGDDTWEDVADAIVPSQTNRFRSKRK